MKGIKAAIEYIAENDEPTYMNVTFVSGMPSVHLTSLLFDKTEREIAQRVVKLREKMFGFKEEPDDPD